MIEPKNFRWNRPPYLLAPYVLNQGMFGPEALVAIFNRLKQEDLYKIVFHDNPDMNLLDFMNFFSHPTVALQIISIVEGDQIKDMAGMSWLSGMESYADGQRAVASFCAFKDYQTPDKTDAMAAFVLDYWFNCLNLDIVVGMTPAANVLAVRFIKRIGFLETCRIPDYSALFGKKTDCVVTYMNKDQYGKVYGGQ